jgi:hypothetical protein
VDCMGNFLHALVFLAFSPLNTVWEGRKRWRLQTS